MTKLFYFRNLPLILFFLVLAVFKTPGQIPNWDGPIKDKDPQKRTFGGVLEEQYQKIIDRCSLGNLFFVDSKKAQKYVEGQKIDTQDQKQASAIPRVLQTQFKSKMTFPVISQNVVSINRLFAYAFEKKEISGDGLKDQFYFYNQDFYADPAKMIPWEQSYTVYTHSCSNIVNSALDANASYSLPFFTVKGALKSEFSGNQRVYLGLVEGTFTSPFTVKLESSTAPERLTALLRLWDWYRQLPSAQQTKTYYRLRQFDGITFFQLFDQTRSTDGKIDFGGSVDYFVSVKSDNSIQSKNDLTTNIRDWGTAYYKDSKVDTWFEELKTPEQIQNTIKDGFQFTKVENINESLTIRETEIVEYSRKIENIPKDYCKPGIWRPDSIAEGTLSIKNIVFDQDKQFKGEIGRCTLTISFTPKSAIWKENAKTGTPINVSYNLQSQSKISALFIEIPVEAISFNTVEFPQINNNNISDPNVYVTSGVGTDKKLSWTITLSAIDPTNTINWSSVNIPNSKITCKTSTRVFEEYDLIPQTPTAVPGAPDKKLIPLSINQIVRITDNLDINEKNESVSEQCTISGTVRFTRIAGGTIDKTFDRKIDYPQIKPKQEPVIPQSTPSPAPTNI